MHNDAGFSLYESRHNLLGMGLPRYETETSTDVRKPFYLQAKMAEIVNSVSLLSFQTICPLPLHSSWNLECASKNVHYQSPMNKTSVIHQSVQYVPIWTEHNSSARQADRQGSSRLHRVLWNTNPTECHLSAVGVYTV